MKKIIATVLTAFLLLSVVACENVSDERTSYGRKQHYRCGRRNSPSHPVWR